MCPHSALRNRPGGQAGAPWTPPPGNVHRLDTIADASKNDMARVGAIKALEQISDQADEKNRGGPALLPGLQIVIIGGTPPRVVGPPPFSGAAVIEHEPAERAPRG
jgi:hypothetical protein